MPVAGIDLFYIDKTKNDASTRLSSSKLKVVLELSAGPDSNEKQVELEYEIFDTQATRRWLRLLEQDLKCKPFWYDGIFYGDIFKKNGVAELSQEINAVLARLDVPGGRLFSRWIRPLHDAASVDALHELKVEFMRLHQAPKFEFPNSFMTDLELLNFLVHRVEFSSPANSGQGGIVAVPFRPSRVPLSDKEFLEFSPDTHFGYLYLDYATNGVPVLESFRSSLSQCPTPQSDLSSGFWLSFWNDRKFDDGTRGRLRLWLKKNYPDLVDNPKAAIGNIPLGRLRFNSIGGLTREQLIERLQRARAIRSVVLALKPRGEGCDS